MVSKAAVIALVAILACPILLGYGLSLNETTKTEYSSENDPVNVTPLLQNNTGYSYTDADVYQLNTNFDNLPYYNTLSDVKTSFPLQRANYNGHPLWGGANGIPVSTFDYIYYQTSGNTTTGYVTLTIKDGDTNTVIDTFSRFHSLKYGFDGTGFMYVSYYDGDDSSDLYLAQVGLGASYKMILSSSSYTGRGYAEFVQHGQNPKYVNFADGFYFVGDVNPDVNKLFLPEYTKDVLLTFNLDSITSSYYHISTFNGSTGLYFYMEKTITGGEVKWRAVDGSDSSNYVELYYDPSRTDNTYQVTYSLVKTAEDSSYRYYECKAVFDYVGGWPSIIGKANSYQQQTLNITVNPQTIANTEYSFNSVVFMTSGNSPTMRVDGAVFRAFEYPIIYNKTYDPSSFRDNPSTIINSVTVYGNSIIFGNQTYTVDSSGNITLGTHKVSVKGLVLDSIPTVSGYNNRINGNIISTTVQPSTITFDGTWSASIETTSQSAITVTDTEWIPGQFAWNGIDDNFLIVGLLTSLGAFIGLAIYSRRSKSSLWPLMIVCGGAAMLFLFML